MYIYTYIGFACEIGSQGIWRVCHGEIGKTLSQGGSFFFSSATVVRWIPWSFLRWMWVNCNGLSYLFCDGECRYGVQILAMSHEPCIFVEYIEWGAPNHPSVSFPSLPKKCGRYAASPRRTPPEEAPVPEESKANIQNERLGEVLPTWLALS